MTHPVLAAREQLRVQLPLLTPRVRVRQCHPCVRRLASRCQQYQSGAFIYYVAAESSEREFMPQVFAQSALISSASHSACELRGVRLGSDRPLVTTDTLCVPGGTI